VGIEPTSLAWKTSAFAARPRAHAEGEGVEPSRLVARPFSRRLPSPIGLPFRFSSCGGRNRTCNRLLNREPPYHSATPQEVRTVGFEPTLSGSRNRRIPRLSYVLNRHSQPTAQARAANGQSTQRESNPHVLHGEQAGCRYITGASVLITLRVMLHHAKRDDYIFSGTRGTRTLTTLVKSQVCCR
jgi:hypothetical protein